MSSKRWCLKTKDNDDDDDNDDRKNNNNNNRGRCNNDDEINVVGLATRLKMYKYSCLGND